LTYISVAESIGVPLLRNPPRKLPNLVKLRGGYGYYAVQAGSSNLTEFVTNRKLDMRLPISDYH